MTRPPFRKPSRILMHAGSVAGCPHRPPESGRRLALAREAVHGRPDLEPTPRTRPPRFGDDFFDDRGGRR